ncbi:hypothetical protein ACU686_15235 [Yinghuangia aomiensis]
MAGPADSGATVFAAAFERFAEGGIPEVADVPDASLDLVERIRDLVEATVRTDVGPEARAEAAKLVSRAADLLRAATHDQVVRFARTSEGRIDQLTHGRVRAAQPAGAAAGLSGDPRHGDAGVRRLGRAAVRGGRGGLRG